MQAGCVQARAKASGVQWERVGGAVGGGRLGEGGWDEGGGGRMLVSVMGEGWSRWVDDDEGGRGWSSLEWVDRRLGGLGA